MGLNRAWSAYPATYRAREMRTIASWIMTNTSGSVVGLPGIGKSNLLGYLCHRSDVLPAYLPRSPKPVLLIPVDLNNLPSTDLATFYRVILRAFYEFRQQLESGLQQSIGDLYLEVHNSRDPFLSQSALRELLQEMQSRGVRVVLVLDRFDTFCQDATAYMTDTLRGLRDSFKDTLAYIVAMTQEVVYLPEPGILGELLELLDMNVCWVGCLDDDDSRHLIATVTDAAPAPPTEAVIGQLQRLSGGYPALLKAACQWWLTHSEQPEDEWEDALLNEPSVRYRVERIWAALSQEEQRVLARVQLQTNHRPAAVADHKTNVQLAEQELQTLNRLAMKGIGRWVEQASADRRWRVSGRLLAAYITMVGGQSRGKLWYDDEQRIFYQGQDRLEALSPLEGSLLKFLLTQPRVRHTYTELIEAAWPDEVYTEGVSTEALYQLVRGLRRKVEVRPSRPQYIVNWRGRPEGGYQCFPEGRPR